ncbi:MAG TPA: hypothetical protein VFV99_21780 [Kofleriaceae bacterium]|nr:hypothetical protein [Kofleriaceae bacterium]
MLDPVVGASKLALDKEHLIVSGTLDCPRLFVMHRDGTGRHVVFDANSLSNVCDVWADDRDIFVSCDRGLGRVDKSGTFRQLAPYTHAHICCDEEFLYGTQGVGRDENEIGAFRIPRTGGELEWLVRGPTSALTVHDGRLYYYQHQLIRVREPDGATRALAQAEWPGSIVVLGPDEIAWTQNGLVASAKDRLPRTLATPRIATGMIRRGDTLYWGAWEPNKQGLWYMRIDDPTPALVAKFPHKSLSIVADDTHLFWTGHVNGGVYALPRSSRG